MRRPDSQSIPGRIAAAMITAEKSSPTTRRSFQSASATTTIATTISVETATRLAVSIIAPLFPANSPREALYERTFERYNGAPMAADELVVHGAREHNLKDITVRLPRNALICITGLSGSGKSSLAFDKIYAEGQRRYVESLSAYARQFLGQMDKPDVDFIEGLSPAVSIDQKTTSRNPRSTVGTVTEIYDYLRLLFARAGKPHCPKCGKPISRQTPQQIVDQVLAMEEGTRFQVLAPVVRGRKGEFVDLFDQLNSQGYSRVRVDGETIHLAEPPKLKKQEKHTI